jgi:hypothetical protein
MLRYGKYYQVVIFFMTAVFILPSTFLQAQVPSATPVPFVRASENPCLRALPPDWWMAGNFDCKSYFDAVSSVHEGNAAMALAMNQYIQMVQGMTGINLQNDVQYATFFTAGDPDADSKFLGILKGSFDNNTVGMRLAFTIGAGMKSSSYRELTIYEGETVGYTFPETSTLMMGTPSLLRQAADALKEKSKALPESLDRVLERTNGRSICWVTFRPRIVLQTKDAASFRENNSDLCRRLSEVECASLFFEPAPDGFLASGLAWLKEKTVAKGLHAYLSSWKGNLLKSEGANVFLCSFLISSEVMQDEHYVRWNLHLTEKSLKNLWNTKVVLKPAN